MFLENHTHFWYKNRKYLKLCTNFIHIMFFLNKLNFKPSLICTNQFREISKYIYHFVLINSFALFCPYNFGVKMCKCKRCKGFPHYRCSIMSASLYGRERFSDWWASKYVSISVTVLNLINVHNCSVYFRY